MSNTILENIRSKNEELEHLEKALTKAIAYKENNQKEKVFAELLIKKFLKDIKKLSKELIDFYEDKEGLKKEEIDILAGNKNFYDSNLSLLGNGNYSSNRTPDVWLNFYEKVKEVKYINRKIFNNNEFAEHVNFEKIFTTGLEEINNKSIFTAEENKGKCVDMHEIYQIFMNLKKIKEGNFLNIDDYISFISYFYKFEKIPIYLKKQNNYREYLNNIYRYLKYFIEKSNPMIEINAILDSIDEGFEENWRDNKIEGWETYLKQLRNYQDDSNINVDGINTDNFNNINIKKDNMKENNENNDNTLFCVACQKLFTNSSVFDHHKKGKSHLKNTEKIKNEISYNIRVGHPTNNDNMDKNNQLNLSLKEDRSNTNGNQLFINERLLEKIRETNESKEEEIRTIAYFEFSINKFCEILNVVLENTQNTIRKKQSRNYGEIEAEVENSEDLEFKENEESDEEEKPIYNPKNVPLGWDGKPIPYWLYKLHGLGIEYKCEICGGASYWGRRAFERHFQEWRHSYGMKCLKIPNTVHFKEVTSIEDALRLHQGLLEGQKKKAFRPDVDEEFEDTDGNVVNKKMFIDLKRQGLL